MTQLLVIITGLGASSLGSAQTVEVLPAPGPAACCPQGTMEPCRTCPIEGVDCLDNMGGTEPCWKFHRPLPWQVFAQGEYVGPYRPAHVPEYRLRVDDELDFAYRITRDVDPVAYELNVGDKIRVESVGDSQLDRELIIQPDGNITLRLLGQVRAAGRSVQQLRDDLERQYMEYYKEPSITVTPIEVNTKLNDLRAVIDRRAGFGGQFLQATVSPDGTVQLPALGSIPAQGLTLDELKVEVDERYRFVVEGIEVTPILTKRAPRYIYVLGEVNQPGRFELTGPTTAMQAVALAGGWVNGGNLREMVIFRRAEDWRLIATRLDLRGALFGKRPIPADEIWLRDADIVLIPQTPLRRATDLIDLVFGKGINQMIPLAEGLEILTPTRF
jgi:polysaccharide export outer membrane protein